MQSTVTSTKSYTLRICSTRDEVEGEATPAIDKQARAFIVLQCKSHHYPLLRKSTTAAEAWDALKDVYQAKGNASRMQLLSELQSIKLADKEDMTVYISRAQHLRDRLADVGDSVSDTQVVLNLLNGLPKAYAIEKVMLAHGAGELDLESVSTTLLQAEARARDDQSSASYGASYNETRGVALYSKGRGYDDKRCHYCNKTGHVLATCRMKARHDKEREGEDMSKAMSAVAL